MKSEYCKISCCVVVVRSGEETSLSPVIPTKLPKARESSHASHDLDNPGPDVPFGDRANTDLVEVEFHVRSSFAAPVDVTLNLTNDGHLKSQGGFPFPSPRPHPLLVWLFMPVLAPFPAPVCRDPLGVIV